MTNTNTDIVEKVAQLAGWVQRQDDEGVGFFANDMLGSMAEHVHIFGEWQWQLTERGLVVLIDRLLKLGWSPCYEKRAGYWYCYALVGMDNTEAATLAEATCLAYLSQPEGQ